MKQKQNLWITLGVVAFVLLAAGLLGLYFGTREAPTEGQKHITVSVTHADGSVKTFTYDTDAQYLGPYLTEQGLIEGEQGPYGLEIHKVDGEKADWNENQSYWAIYEGDAYATTGIDQIVITHGASYGLVYTIG